MNVGRMGRYLPHLLSLGGVPVVSVLTELQVVLTLDKLIQVQAVQEVCVAHQIAPIILIVRIMDFKLIFRERHLGQRVDILKEMDVTGNVQHGVQAVLDVQMV